MSTNAKVSAGASEQDSRPGTDTEITKPGTRRSDRDCKPLLEAATKDLFRNNAFRVTGLSVGATTREVARHANKLTQLAELGQDLHIQNAAAFPMKPPPGLDEIREAIQRLNDPERRLIDEFFWFWPCELGKTTSEPALEALASGNADAALKIWAANETNPSSGVVATHNIALFWQLRAFDLETDNASRAEAGGGGGHSPGRSEADCVQEQAVEKYWRNSLKRWKYLAFDDLLWDKVAERVRQTDDPRLTSGFVRRMRATLPLALAKINAELALAHAQKDRMPLAKMHVRLLREGTVEPTNVEKAAELVLTSARNRLQEQIRRAKDRGDKNPRDAANATRELLEEARNALALFDLFFEADSDVRNELFDEAASVCNRLQITYHNATRDDKTCLEILKLVLPLATSTDLRQSVEKDISETRVRLLHALLKSIQDSKDCPSAQLILFRRDAVPAIAEATGITGFSPNHGYLSATSADHTQLFDTAAIVLRGISFDAWHNHQDQRTAVAANELALMHAVSPELKQRLAEDQATFRQQRPDPEWTPAEPATNFEILRANKGWFVAAAIVAIIVLTMVLVPNEPSNSPQNSHSTSLPANTHIDFVPEAAAANRDEFGGIAVEEKSAPSPPAVPNQPPRIPTSPGWQTYSSLSAELDRDKQAIGAEKAKSARMEALLEQSNTDVEAKKSEIDDLDTSLDSLSRQIELDRIYLDRTSQFEIDSFNLKIGRYNAALRNRKAEVQVFNQVVEAHNALVQQLKTQNRLVNQMVDSYNAKLRQYSR
jgi:hypothetical protein